jgi:hypothetical protein
MKALLGAIAALAALLLASGASADPLRYGVADDWPQFHTCGDEWWQAAKDIGYTQLRMTVQWNADSPAVIPNQGNIAAAVDCAQLNDVKPILAVYPLKPSAIGANVAMQRQFAAFVALVGTAFPGVRDFIVGNEPNVNRFWQPQYRRGTDAAAVDYEHMLAASYDALKAVRPDAFVWGPAISSRGNDDPKARSNPSHSPVWFIKDLGDAYRKSGRTIPIFDVFDMHPYPPIQDTLPFTAPFRWPKAGAANLDRIKQALWDAFHKTGQPIVTEQPGMYSLPVALDEVAEQTVVTGHAEMYGDPPENVIPITERQQASAYVQVAELAACDSSVTSLLYFPLIDGTQLADGFQSGSLYADLTHKLSYAAVKQKIASAQGFCQGGISGVPRSWRHATQVIGATGAFGVDGGSPGAHRPAGVTPLQTEVTAAEDATYSATLRRVGGGPVGLPLKGTMKAYVLQKIAFKLAVRPGRYAITVELRAVTNPGRFTLLRSRPFAVTQPPAR